jgi:hypothetical protein
MKLSPRHLIFTCALLALTAGALTLPQGAESLSWPPPGASTTYPRTMMNSSEIATIKSSLATNTIYTDLYSDIYSNTQEVLPNLVDTSTGGRRAVANRAKNNAFVYLMGVDNTGAVLSAGDLLTLKGDAMTLLEGASSSVSDFVVYTFGVPTGFDYLDWQWTTKEMMALTSAYDLLRGAGVPEIDLANSKTNITAYLQDQYEESIETHPTLVAVLNGLNTAGDWVDGSFFHLINNNHATMVHNALIYGAIVFDDHASASNWANYGMYYQEKTLFTHSEKAMASRTLNAGYAEGPHYWIYHSYNHLPAIQALKNYLPDGTHSWTSPAGTETIRHPAYDPAISAINQWMVEIALPDGRMPALEDSFHDDTFQVLALYEDSSYVLPVTFSENLAGSAFDYKNGINNTVDLRADFISSQTSESNPSRSTLYINPESGDIVMRSSEDSDATYLHATGQNGLPLTAASGHNQGDETSFMLVHKGKELLIDPGYLSWDQRSSVSGASSHNLILIDGNGPDDCESWVDTLCLGVNAAEASTVSQISDGSFAQSSLIDSTYESVDVDRNILSINKGEYFLIHDNLDSGSSHTYTHQLHGIETYTTAGDISTWTHDGSALDVAVVSDTANLSSSTRSDIHEIKYSSDGVTVGSHTVLETQSQLQNQVMFGSILVPYDAGSATHAITPTSSSSSVSSFLYENSNIKDVILLRNTKTAIAANTTTTTAIQSGGPDEIATDADLLVVRYTNDEITSVYAQGVTTITIGGDYSKTFSSESVWEDNPGALSTISSTSSSSSKSSARRVGNLTIGFRPVGSQIIVSDACVYDGEKEILAKALYLLIEKLTGRQFTELLC